MKKKLELKNKLINHIMINGNKKTSEKILLKSFKKLQKESQKQSKKIFQLAVINSTPIFKLHIYKMKKKRKKRIKEIPTFITNKYHRISLSLKFILSKILENKQFNKFFNEFKKEILITSQRKGVIIESKNNLQKQALLKKHLLVFYRWKK
jgi:ribosomal protein S7